MMRNPCLATWLCLLGLFLLAVPATAQQQPPGPNFLAQLLQADTSRVMKKVLAARENYRMQIIYTRIDRDSLNHPHFTSYSMDADQYYYYCASMIKLPAVILSLEKLNNLYPEYHVTKFDSLVFKEYWSENLNAAIMMDTSANPCIAQYAKEIFLVSNNAAFNPLYDFLGQQYFADRAHELGLNSVVLCSHFAGLDTFENRITNPYGLFDRKTKKEKYYSEPRLNRTQPRYQGPLNPVVGNQVKKYGKVVFDAHDFTYANYVSLSDLNRLIREIMFPESQPDSQRINLSKSDYEFLHKYMSMFPREARYPAYDTSYHDNIVKYFIQDSTGRIPRGFRDFNKVGWAYGFLTDCSYFQDTIHHVEFLLSASIFSKDNNTYDGHYDYFTTGLPFLHRLFHDIYTYELKRPRKYQPVFEKIIYQDDLLPAKMK